MPQACSVCHHADREEIDQALVRGAPNRRIASQFNLSETSIRRHKSSHLPQSLVQAAQAKQEAEATSLLGEVRTSQDRTERLYQAAEEILARSLDAKDLKTALKGIQAAVNVLGEARAYLELKGRLTGELNRETAAGNQSAVIILPALVPLGSPADLKMKLPPEAEVEAMIREKRVSGGVRIIETKALPATED